MNKVKNYHQIFKKSRKINRIFIIRKETALLGIITSVLCILSIPSAMLLSKTSELSGAAIESCSSAVQLAIYLAGAMALWGGLMRIAQKAGITAFFEKLLSPVTNRLFKECDGETMKNISMNLTANMLGISNAATPLGIAAVRRMSRSGSRYAKRNIAMLTVLNTASIQLIPTTVGALRARYGSESPFDITLPVLTVSLISAAGGCLTVWALSMKGRRKCD